MNLEVNGVEYKGVAEQADPIIDNAYKDSIRDLQESKER